MAAMMEALGTLLALHCATACANAAFTAGSGPPSVGHGGLWGRGGHPKGLCCPHTAPHIPPYTSLYPPYSPIYPKYPPYRPL